MSETSTPRDRLPTAEEAFAERLAPLLELVERWRARIVTEARSWPAIRDRRDVHERDRAGMAGRYWTAATTARKNGASTR